MKAIFIYFFRRLFPMRYARRIGVKFGHNCRFINVTFSTEAYLIKMGDHVSATACHFETHDGGVWVFRQNDNTIDIVKPIVIGNNVFIGFGSVILPGTIVGDNVVIGARSVVGGVVPSGVVVAGVPAKIIKSIDEYEIKSYRSSNPTALMSFDAKKSYYLDKYLNH